MSPHAQLVPAAHAAKLPFEYVTPYPVPLRLMNPSHPPLSAVFPEMTRNHPVKALEERFAVHGAVGHPAKSALFALIHPMFSLHAYPVTLPSVATKNPKGFEAQMPEFTQFKSIQPVVSLHA